MAKEITLKQHLTKIGALGGKKRARPTKCERCGELQPTARAAWMHCRKPRAKKTAVKKHGKAGIKKRSATDG